jgi:hypothetical protein
MRTVKKIPTTSTTTTATSELHLIQAKKGVDVAGKKGTQIHNIAMVRKFKTKRHLLIRRLLKRRLLKRR